MEEYKFFDYKDIVHYPGEHISPHKHDYFELVYYVSGEGTTNLGAEEMKYGSDTVLLVKKGVLHFEKIKSRTQVQCIGFDCSKDLAFENALVSKNKNNKKFFENILSRLVRVRGQVFGERNDVDLNDEVSYIALSLLSILDDEKRKESDLYASTIKNVRNYIKANYNKTINFTILCESIGYSYDWFRHIFKAKTGVSMKKYQQSLRISNAKIMLQEKDMSIKGIARQCGFKSDIRFIDYFKQTQLMSPNQYRKASRSSSIGIFSAKSEGR